ncbi:RING-H2 finger protein ATL34-like [Mercurialis annua]|uniref:RING-H2 finger protein ATL34-like n=1 Tax=Mercurialis annua TaxID=3986 RepID=UPI0024AD9FFE|nr:RING-H2 finger protein ATL34-like [Mercurialis annua]
MHRYFLSDLSPPSLPPDQPIWIRYSFVPDHAAHFFLLVIVLVLVLIFISTAVVCLCPRNSNIRYVEDNEPEHVHGDIEIGAAERREGTLTLIQLFKKVIYSKKKKVSTGEEDDDVCPICLEELEDEDECVVLPCSHMFHELCLQHWLNKNTLCPICRADAWEIRLENQV